MKDSMSELLMVPSYDLKHKKRTSIELMSVKV